MELNSLRPALGATKKRKRIGRGPGSGHGKTATKGHKGQKARSGGSVKAGFEGGQMPLQRRLPKRGFTPLSRTEYAVINLKQLNAYEDGSIVDLQSLQERGIIKKALDGLKVLADGVLERKLTVKAHRFSDAAKEKIAAAGGTAEEI
jgi:large subunit ribosomal protein L15